MRSMRISLQTLCEVCNRYFIEIDLLLRELKLIVANIVLILFSMAFIIPSLGRSTFLGLPALAAIFIPANGICLWFALANFGIGAQSLSNLIELFAVVPGTIIAACLVLKKMRNSPPQSAQIIVVSHIVVALSVVALRVFMPELPE
jgi:hypothetical protein